MVGFLSYSLIQIDLVVSSPWPVLAVRLVVTGMSRTPAFGNKLERCTRSLRISRFAHSQASDRSLGSIGSPIDLA